MNFYDLFEKKTTTDRDEMQDVTIADPKAALALKQARAKYSYTDNDLEAFVKMVQDEQEEEQDEIDELEAETAHQEELIQRNIEALQQNQETIQKTKSLATAAKERADHLERENSLQRQRINDLEATEKGYQDWADKLIRDLNTMTQRFDGMDLPSGKFRAATLDSPKAPEPKTPATSMPTTQPVRGQE